MVGIVAREEGRKSGSTAEVGAALSRTAKNRVLPRRIWR